MTINAKSSRSTFFSVLAVVASVIVAAVLFPLITMRVPVRQRLTQITNSSQTFSMICHYRPGYQLLLGVPTEHAGKLNFRGEIVFRQRTNEILRLSIGSDDITPCNWLPTDSRLQGYILTWAGTNRGLLERCQVH